MELKYLKNYITFVCLFMGLGGFAQTAHLHGEIFLGPKQTIQLYANPMDKKGEGIPCKLQKNTFDVDIPVSSNSFYEISGILKDSIPKQVLINLYLPSRNKKTLSFKYDTRQELPVFKCDRDNEAIFMYTQLANAKSRNLFMGSVPKDKIVGYLKSYSTLSDSIAKSYRCSPLVTRYLSIDSYLSTYQAYFSVNRVYQIKKKESISLPILSIISDPKEILDQDLAMIFYNTPFAIVSFIPSSLSLEEKINYLSTNYKCKSVRDRVLEYILDNYISHHNYVSKYDEGLTMLSQLAKKYSFVDKFVDKYKKRRYIQKGSPFPPANLLDNKGNSVDIGQFKGYYLYIDLWASWCVPCCKEVPYLQELEKSITNDKIKFISISLDENETAWKKKMEMLHSDGIQLICKDSSISDFLNITGIPHFMIYDDNGKLLYYDAPRPSSDEIRPVLNYALK